MAILLLLLHCSLSGCIIALLRRGGDLKALDEFLVVLACRALPIPYALYRML